MSDNIIIDTTTETYNLSVSTSTETFSLSITNVEGPTRWGLIVGTLSAQTDLWNALSASSTGLPALSASVTDLITFLNVTSGSWNGGFDAFTTVSTNSAYWNSAHSWVQTNSANATFQTVSANSLSGIFYGDGSNLIGASLPGQAGINTLVRSNSASWDTAYNTALAYQNVSGSYVTNTLLQGTSALLTPLTTTNTLTSLLVLKSTFNNYQTSIAAATATLLPTSVYQDASGNWQGTFTSVQSNSANWNYGFNTGTSYSQNSASYATYDYVDNNFFNLSGGTISGATKINNNLTVFGNITATGTTTFANTVFSTTSSLSVVHVGSGPAMYVGNNGDGDIASFYDIDSNVEILHVGGNNGSFPNVGVKTSTPNVDFTVNGQISANNTIWSAGGNSNNWNSNFTSWNSASATSVVSFNDTRFSKLSSQAYTLTNSTTASIQPILGGNTATGSYSVIAGGRNNTASGNYSNVVGGCCNIASGDCSSILGGKNNCASGWGSNITGGASNTSSGYGTHIGGGISNSAIGDFSNIAGGFVNTACGGNSNVAGGYANAACGNSSNVAGGRRNCALGDYSNVAGGSCNTASGSYSNVAGGCNNTASGVYSTVLGGRFTRATQFGEISHSSSRFGSTNGNFQHSIFTASTVTTNAVPKDLTLDGVSTYFSVTSGTSYFFNINVLAYNLSTTLAGYFTFKGFVKNPTGTITLSPNNIQEIITEDSNIQASVGVDAVNKYLTISVIGASAANVRWGAVIDTVKIMTT
jgi:hypothetical protein